MEEVWKPVKDFDNYFISNLGRVKSTYRSIDRILKIDINKQGQSRTYLFKKNKLYCKNVTSLVAETFLEYTPNGSLVLIKKDGDISNNAADNIEIITSKDNWKIICKSRYNYEVEVNSYEYKRISYICKRENISRQEYFLNIEKYNISKRRTKHLEYTPETTEYRKNIWLKKNYGLNLKEYNEILKNQNGVCLICGNKEITKGRHTDKIISLSVDHDHKTGQVRGLLCYSCNVGLGAFKDDVQLLRNAIAYISTKL